MSEQNVSTARVFLALLRRDAHVARRELVFFLIRTTLQPLMFVIIFGFVMPKMGIVGRNYSSLMLPGIVAISLAMSAITAVSFPMIVEFGHTKEIEDRLLAPVPNQIVAIEKPLPIPSPRGAILLVIAQELHARDALAHLPALTLVDLEDRDGLVEREGRYFSQESVEVGSLALVPPLLEA